MISRFDSAISQNYFRPERSEERLSGLTKSKDAPFSEEMEEP